MFLSALFSISCLWGFLFFVGLVFFGNESYFKIFVLLMFLFSVLQKISDTTVVLS